MPESDEYNIESTDRKWFDWKELVRYHELFYFFTWRDIKIKYKQTALGVFWAILQPLVMMIIIEYSISRLFPQQILPYPVFLLSGLLIWNIFSNGLTNASNSMISNALIIKKIYFPRLVIPVAAVLSSVFDFLFALILLIGCLIFYKQPVSWHVLWCWPAALLVAFIATLGPSCLLAALNVKYRDFRYVIPFLIQALFFLTPIIFPINTDSDPLKKYIMACNPLYAAVQLFRFPLVEQLPDASLIVLSVSFGFVLLALGLGYFRKTERFFADLA